MSADAVPAGWIPEDEYALIRERVPIVCVDLLAVSESEVPRVGLIFRPTYDDASAWCLIGGSVQLNEALQSAVQRHLQETLVCSEAFDTTSLEFLRVFEYFKELGLGPLYDPRKHAVSATFVGHLRGTPTVQDNRDGASRFAWFEREQLNDLELGFGQRFVIDTYFDRIG